MFFHFSSSFLNIIIKFEPHIYKHCKRFTGAFGAGTELSASVFVTEAGDSSAGLFSGVLLSAFVSGFATTVSLLSASCDSKKRESDQNGTFNTYISKGEHRNASITNLRCFGLSFQF